MELLELQDLLNEGIENYEETSEEPIVVSNELNGKKLILFINEWPIFNFKNDEQFFKKFDHYLDCWESELEKEPESNEKAMLNYIEKARFYNELLQLNISLYRVYIKYLRNVQMYSHIIN